MACKEDRLTLGDRTYLIRQLPPRKSVPVQVYLAKTLGQPLFQAFTNKDLSDDTAFGIAVGLFTEKLDDDGLLKTMQSIFQYVGILGKVIRICEESDGGMGLDVQFEGRTKELWQVFWKALQVNYADFFGDVLSRFNQLERLRTGTQSTQATSTSTSGDLVSQNPVSAETSNI